MTSKTTIFKHKNSSRGACKTLPVNKQPCQRGILSVLFLTV